MKWTHLALLGLTATTAGCSSYPKLINGIRGSDNGGHIPSQAVGGDLDLTGASDLGGRIASSSGSEAAMAGWVVSSFEYETGISRVGEVDGGGHYVLSHLRRDHRQTLALLNPDYVVQAVTSIPGDDPKAIRQFVSFDGQDAPGLTNNGCIMTFDSLDGLRIDPLAASSQQGNGVPDGCAKLMGDVKLTPLGQVPQDITASGAPPPDGHGLDPRHDPDIDADGIINWLDPDENSNGVLNVFDPDQNGDLVNDMTPAGHDTDQWFTEGIQYLAVQYQMVPKTDGSGMDSYLKFNVKLADDIPVPVIQIRGAPSLLNGATYTTRDARGNPSVVAWDRTLADDGQNEDEAAHDRIFGRKVLLAAGKEPLGNQVLFFQLVMGDDPANPWFVEFPFTFPPIHPAPVTAQYDANTRMVTLVGNPFGTIQDFVWTISVFDANGINVWSSGAAPGTTRQQAIQQNIFPGGNPAGHGNTFAVTAASLDKVPAMPAYSVSSARYELK